jgi:hypothetical protein
MLLFKPTGELDYINVGLIGLGVISLVIAGMLFVYNQSLAAKLQERKLLLSQKEKEMGTLPVDEIRKLNLRLKYANLLANNYAYSQTAFTILGQTIENPVTFTSLSLDKDSRSPRYTITINGSADSYRTLKQQMITLFNKEQQKYLTNINLKSFGLEKTSGKIGFNFTADIKYSGILPDNPDLLLLSTSKPETSTTTP